MKSIKIGVLSIVFFGSFVAHAKPRGTLSLQEVLANAYENNLSLRVVKSVGGRS